MSKKNRNRAAREEQKKAEAELLRYKETKKKVRRITAIVTISIIALVFAMLFIFLGIYNSRLNKGDYLREKVAVSSKNTEVDGAMMNFYFNDFYNTFVSYYGSYVIGYGLDTAKPLASQYMSDGQSWYDYFMEGARVTVTSTLVFAEEAKADGVSLTDEEKSALLGRADDMDEGLYGRGVNHDDIFAAKQLEALSYKFRFMKEREFTPDEAEIETYYNENAKLFQLADYYEFHIYYNDEAEDGSEALTKEEAEALTQKFDGVSSKEEFHRIVREILIIENADITEDEINDKIEQLEIVGESYTENELSEWVFSADVGSTHIIHDGENKQYNVYFLTSEPYLDEGRTVNVRQILFSDSRYGSREAALEAAENVLEKLKNSEDIEEDFALFALEFSEDEATYYNGGLYENIKEGRMIEVFNNWCFDEKRQIGELGIVESDFGPHLIYYVGDGLLSWQADVADTVAYEKLSEYTTELENKHPILFDESVFDMIPDPGA